MCTLPPPQCDVCELVHRPREKILFFFNLVYMCAINSYCVIATLQLFCVSANVCHFSLHCY